MLRKKFFLQPRDKIPQVVSKWEHVPTTLKSILNESLRRSVILRFQASFFKKQYPFDRFFDEQNASFTVHVHLSDLLGMLLHIRLFQSRSSYTLYQMILLPQISRNYEDQNPKLTKLWKVFVRVQAVGVSKNGMLKITK